MNANSMMSPADLLAVIDDCASKLDFHYRDTRFGKEMRTAFAAVAALIEREAALTAERAELLEALQRVMKLHVPYTGNPTHARLVDYWEFEKQQGRGCADDMLFALSAIASAEARHD